MKKYIGIILFICAMIVGLCTYKNYGISWDEGFQRHLGLMTYHYFSYGRDSLMNCNNSQYGAAFELPLIIIEKGFHLKDSREIFLMRHLVTHIFFLISALVFFLLIDRLFKSKVLASIGFLLLVTHPVIYSHSFYNSKDIVFLSMNCICYYLALVAFEKNKVKNYVFLGIACGLFTNLRIMGCLLTLCLMLFLLADYIRARGDKTTKKQIIRYFLAYFISWFVILYLVSPYLYPNPIQNIVYIFRDMASHYPVQVIFNGKSVNPQNLPYYAITIFGITTPMIYLGLGILGTVFLVVDFCKNPLPFFIDKNKRNITLYAIGFFQPLLSIIIFHSEIFDGWRHLLFIYPSFVLLCIYGLWRLSNKILKYASITVACIGITSTIAFIIFNFPYENVYFNRLAGNENPENIRKKWETDYWGNSYFQALQYIASHDSASHISVRVVGLAGVENAYLLKPEDRKRMIVSQDASNPDFVVAWYKNHPQDYDWENREVFSIKAMNSKIISVFKLK